MSCPPAVLHSRWTPPDGGAESRFHVGKTVRAKRDREENEGYILAIESREITDEMASEWRTACASLLTNKA